MTSEIALRESALPAIAHERSIEELVAQANKIRQAMEQAMEVDHHFGKIPGTPKPTLFKPGAEKLCLLFRLDPQYHSEPVGTDGGNGGHLTIKSVCTLWHIPTGQRFGSGEASCSTREAKYAYRQANRKCPQCGKEAIIRGKSEYGGGWLCFKRKDGCGAKFKDGDASIENQPAGRIANDDLADNYNTVLKMANKRALVAAVLNVTAASDVFTQDLEDFRDEERDAAPARRAATIIVSEPDRGPGIDSALPDDEDGKPPADTPLEPELERSLLMTRIKGAADKLKYKADVRAKLWEEYVGQDQDPRTASIEKLNDLLNHLRKLGG